MRRVLDTNVVVAAMRSPAGASALLLMAARAGRITLVANVALALECEAICRRPQHMAASGLGAADVEIFLTAVVAMTEPIESHFMWRPQLRDPDDELVLDAAVNGRAAMIVTFNQRDFDRAPGRFGIDVVTPVEAIGRIRS